VLQPLPLVVLAIGCAAFRGPPPEEVPFGVGRAEPVTAEGIEIQIGRAAGRDGGPCHDVKWVLRRTGECRGTETSRLAGRATPTQHVDLRLRSAQAFRECERLLREERFFRMSDRVPAVQLDSTATWISVRIGSRQHSVLVVAPEAPPAGFTRLTEFIQGLTDRARAAEAKD
jgi:hypothetical protein